MHLLTLQAEHMSWLEYNFPQQQPADPLLGLIEELGELAEAHPNPVLLEVVKSIGKLAHAHLKASQSIRGTPEKLQAEARDAIGDIVIYLASYCNTNGYDLDKCVFDAWEEVRNRDWQKYPKDGVSE